MAEATSVTVLVPAWPTRSAAQMTKGKTRYWSGYALLSPPSPPVKTEVHTTTDTANNPVISTS